ncbi:MAG: hypothetical protein AM326_00780 [Candidatus Thorarchaeota archaeon SMTZ-45]|nr:MAG: hypothetical protein AM326_00780 [Candidatus Thorarchaeota archaeon SMTZ-45]
MKMLSGLQLDEQSLHSLAKAKAMKRGVIRREILESYEIAHPIWRIFRHVHFLDANSEVISASLFDMELASLVESFEESLLLWRPRYDGLLQENTPIEYSLDTGDENGIKVLESIVNELIEVRQSAQNDLIGLTKEFMKTQISWKSTASLLLPRTPSSLREQEDIAKEKRSADGLLNASSLVMNSSSDSLVESMKIGESVLVETALIKYTAFENDSVRILVLENPSAESIEDAVSKGRALTRLSEINHRCKSALIANAFI